MKIELIDYFAIKILDSLIRKESQEIFFEMIEHEDTQVAKYVSHLDRNCELAYQYAQRMIEEIEKRIKK